MPLVDAASTPVEWRGGSDCHANARLARRTSLHRARAVGMIPPYPFEKG
jgi:hypothetical protein